MHEDSLVSFLEKYKFDLVYLFLGIFSRHISASISLINSRFGPRSSEDAKTEPLRKPWSKPQVSEGFRSGSNEI